MWSRTPHILGVNHESAQLLTPRPLFGDALHGRVMMQQSSRPLHILIRITRKPRNQGAWEKPKMKLFYLGDLRSRYSSTTVDAVGTACKTTRKATDGAAQQPSCLLYRIASRWLIVE